MPHHGGVCSRPLAFAASPVHWGHCHLSQLQPGQPGACICGLVGKSNAWEGCPWFWGVAIPRAGCSSCLVSIPRAGAAPQFPQDTHVCCAHCPALPALAALPAPSGLVLMFPGQLWQGTVKGQSLNEPLGDLPQLLRIPLPLVRQGSTAHAVSLHHFFPMPFPPACSTQTNQLSMKTQTGAFFLESSSSLALPHVAQVPINLHFCLSLVPVSVPC